MEKQQYLYKAPNHKANLNEMRLEGKWCDVTIKVNEREIPAHKVILAANLKYFNAMLSNDSYQESQEGIINMESVNEGDLEELVAYAYTGEILLTDSNALNLLELANYLGEDGIKKACIEFLKKHLKAEDACQAYKFANSVDCQSLKNAAKAIIVKNFGDCSKSVNYLDFNYDSLMSILSGGRTQSVRMQQMLFEGIMRWIMHDTQCRKIHLNDLLSSIDINKLAANDLIKYIHENLLGTENDYLCHDIISYYQTSKSEPKKQEQTLVVVNRCGRRQSLFQFYSFTEKKWSSPQQIRDVAVYSSCAILNNKLYYATEGSKMNNLQVFDAETKQNTTLHESIRIFDDTAICACSRFLYLCGGLNHDASISNKILRYDPENNSLTTLIPMTNERHLAAAIFYHGCLYVLGGFSGSTLNSVEKYDPATEKWTHVAPMCKARYGHAVAILDGKLYACGGLFLNGIGNTVEVYNPATNSWQLVASMNHARYKFIAVAYENKLLAIGGGTEKTVEVYDPSKNQWQVDHQMSSGLQIGYYTTGGLVSVSCVAHED